MATIEDAGLDQQLSRLLSLPAELVAEVVGHLQNERKTLCSLARVCRYLQPLSESFLYTTIELFDTDDLQKILQAFDARPARIESIHTLKILYKFHNQLGATVEDRNRFNYHVQNMRALKDWHIESPYDNFKWEEGGDTWVDCDMEDFRQALEAASLHTGTALREDIGLSKLEKLIIHSHGRDTDYWDVGGFSCLFRHPSLRFLHISAVIFESAIAELEPFARSTPLSTLIFDECEIKTEALSSILRTPKALKHLVLGENEHNIKRRKGASPNLSRSAEAAVRALSHVAHSLETLEHIDPFYRTLNDPQNPPALHLKGDGMRLFDHLKSIKCDTCSFLYRGIIQSHPHAPPNLQILRVRAPWKRGIDNGQFFDELPDTARYSYLSSLKRVEFMQPVDMESPIYSPILFSEYVCAPARLRDRHECAYKLWKHGITMMLYAEMHIKSGYIPPYLYGEDIPQLFCVYDPVTVGFHRVVDPDAEAELPAPTTLSELIIFDQISGYVFGGHNRLEGLLEHEEPPLLNKMDTREQTNLPETYQLGAEDLKVLKNELRRNLARFQEKSVRIGSLIGSSDWDDGIIDDLMTTIDVDEDEDLDEDFYFDIEETMDEEEDEDVEEDEFEDADEDLNLLEEVAEDRDHSVDDEDIV